MKIMPNHMKFLLGSKWETPGPGSALLDSENMGVQDHQGRAGVEGQTSTEQHRGTSAFGQMAWLHPCIMYESALTGAKTEPKENVSF